MKVLAPVLRARAAWRGSGVWPRLGVLFALGAFSALAHAPFFFQPAYILALCGLLLALDDARRTTRPLRAALVRGWVFGCGYFLASMYWVANAFLVNDDFVWLVWAPLTLFPGGLAIFWAVPSVIYTRLAPSGPARVGWFALIFLLAELVRSNVLSGFAWNLTGHVFQAGGAVSQVASLIGASGLSAFALYAFVAPAALLGPGRAWPRLAPLAAGFLILVGFWVFGSLRLAQGELEASGHTIRVAQLDWPQSEIRPENIDAVLDAYLAVSMEQPLTDVDALIWPEGAIPAWLMNEPRVLRRLGEALPTGTLLIAGAPHVEFGDDVRQDRYFNSLHALKIEQGQVIPVARYDKARLVPFGEANTLAALTRPFGLETLSQYGFGFDPGPGPATLALDSLPGFAPLICYEVIYPRWILRAPDRPQWLLNISNDAWFGQSSGPSQLLNLTAYRSIEEGLPTIRSASSGSSGQIDSYGRSQLLVTVEYSQAFDLSLLKGLDETVYAEYPVWSWVIAFFVLIAFTACLSPSGVHALRRGAPRRAPT